MVLTIHIMGYIIAVLIVDYRLGHCKIVNYRLNVNYRLKTNYSMLNHIDTANSRNASCLLS